MTDTEFETMIADAKARLTSSIAASADQARTDTHAAFNQSYLKLMNNFQKAADDLGVTLPPMPDKLATFVADPEAFAPKAKTVDNHYYSMDFFF